MLWTRNASLKLTWPLLTIFLNPFSPTVPLREETILRLD